MKPWQVVDCYIELPTAPGLGIEVDEDAVRAESSYVEELGGEFYHPSDNSVVDW